MALRLESALFNLAILGFNTLFTLTAVYTLQSAPIHSYALDGKDANGETNKDTAAAIDWSDSEGTGKWNLSRLSNGIRH